MSRLFCLRTVCRVTEMLIIFTFFPVNGMRLFVSVAYGGAFVRNKDATTACVYASVTTTSVAANGQANT